MRRPKYWLTRRLIYNNVEHNTLGDRVSDAEAKALTVALAATLTEVEVKPFADTIGNAANETEVHKLAIRFQEVFAKNVAIY